MEREFSTPLTQVPTFLSTISMVVDDRSAIIQKLIDAERKSPSVYEPTRDLFLSILEGKLSFEQALHQAWRIRDPIEKKCATQILETSKDFLRNEHPIHVAQIPNMTISLLNGLQLAVYPVWVRQFDPDRLMILHFWQTPLTPWQLSAAAAILRLALSEQQPKYSSCELDFISVSLPSIGEGGRRFEKYNWKRLRPLSESELTRFWERFLAAWEEYQRRVPREIKRRRRRSLFDP